MPGVHDRIICSVPSSRRVAPVRHGEPNGTLCFHFGSTHRPPVLAAVLPRTSLSLSLSLSLSPPASRLLSLFLAILSCLSPVSRRPLVPRLPSLLFAFPASVTLRYFCVLASADSARPRERTALVPRSLFCFALRAGGPTLCDRDRRWLQRRASCQE